MGEHFKTCGAVMLFLCREKGGRKQILLQKRCNTGYGDGMWDCGTSGHVEDRESMKAAMIREAKEELGITIQYEDVHFATFTHKTEMSAGADITNHESRLLRAMRSRNRRLYS